MQVQAEDLKQILYKSQSTNNEERKRHEDMLNTMKDANLVSPICLDI